MKHSILGTIFILILCGNANAQITQQWVATYNGQGDYTDRFTCVTNDNNGNIYIGGATVNINQNRDYLIVKMDDAGNIIWRTEFNAPGNGPDEVTAITTDGNGFVYVTGFGKSENTGNDFLTLKIDAMGNIVWQMRYDSPFHQYDQANSLTVDNAGNVFVTGQGDRDSTTINNDDYITLKYNSNGMLEATTIQWLRKWY
nr:SBBP repeat-containing protein [Bacteroidota bacterium]